MNDIIQYFIGAVCPVFDGVMPDWKTHIEVVCVYGSTVCLMGLISLYVVLSTVKGCVIAFARHVGGVK